MRLMNGMTLDSKPMEVKAASKTQAFISEYFNLKKNELKALAQERGEPFLTDKDISDALNKDLTKSDDSCRHKIKMLMEDVRLDSEKLLIFSMKRKMRNASQLKKKMLEKYRPEKNERRKEKS